MSITNDRNELTEGNTESSPKMGLSTDKPDESAHNTSYSAYPAYPTPKAEVFCHKCKGGNPPDASTCMWCHQSMLTPSTTSTTSIPLTTPPVQPQLKSASQQPKSPAAQAKRSNSLRWIGGSSLGMVLIAFVGFCGLITYVARQASRDSAARRTKVALTSLAQAQVSSTATTPATVQVSMAGMNPQSGSNTPVSTTSTGTVTHQMPPTPPVTGYIYSYESHHSISYFAQPYEQFGGVRQLGHPISEPFLEGNTSDGKLYWVQYFEKAVFEYSHFMVPNFGSRPTYASTRT